MEKETRQRLERLSQRARRILEQEFREQLEGRYDILLDGRIPPVPGAHLSPRERVVWDKLVAAVAHKRSQGITNADAVTAYLREAAFQTLNRFVALKMLEARKLVQECISRGEDSAGFREFIALAPGLVALADKGYRLYIESIFDEIAQEVRALFDRRDSATQLWPRRQGLLELLAALNDPDVAAVWSEDETIGWLYQYFNSEDERRQMRAQSQAPRNSRELAVRNQFFTPRYVVQFLTDNSLGRTWCEMRGGETQLANLEYLVKDGGFDTRQAKDPRDLRVLDPACGSGHFLLYAFDLLAGDPTRGLVGVYEEAWRDEAAPLSEVTGGTLKEDYSSEGALRRAVPGLILQHNLHGVDIDPRAAQIAALALWMRAQRAYNDHQVPAPKRPLIGRTNIVTAEPMLGDLTMVAEFASTLRPRVLDELFQRMVDEMRLAGELGSLLKIDRVLESAVAGAREQFVREKSEPRRLPGFYRPRKQLQFDLSGVSDEFFFDSAEERIVGALESYTAEAPPSMRVRRELFAGDLAQGIAFIDVCRKRFDVVLMNPPFGAASLAAKKAFESTYPRTKNDVYAAFVERGIELLHPTGYLGAITSRTGFFLPSFRKWREEILLKEAPPIVFADLGQGVMDGAMVEAAAYCVERTTDDRSVSCAFLRLRQPADKSTALRASVARQETTVLDSRVFGVLPGHSFAHWIPPRLFDIYSDLAQFDDHDRGRESRCGLGTLDDYRFLRLRWERPMQSDLWKPYFSGGTFSPFYEDFWLVAKWGVDGAEVKVFVEGRVGSASRKVQSESYYFRPGFVFPRRTRAFSPKCMPRGGIFSNSGQAGFMESEDLLAGIALLSSSACSSLMTVSQGGSTSPQFEVGQVKRLPWPKLAESEKSRLGRLAGRAWSLKRFMDTGSETSNAFVVPGLLQVRAATLTRRVSSWRGRLSMADRELGRIHDEIDDIGFLVYGIQGEDRRRIEQGLLDTNIQAKEVVAGTDGEGADDWEGVEVDAARMVTSLISWCIGVALGRFDVRLATGARLFPSEPGPFDPLPPCSPGMLVDGDGLPVEAPPPNYPLAFPTDGILVDDPGHYRDLNQAVRAVFDMIFEDADASRDEAAEILGTADLRTWLARDFFESHIRGYSKSRRRAPIFWQISTSSGSYSVWVYIHRATGDTLFRIVNEFVGPKLDHEKVKGEELKREAGTAPSAAQRRELERQGNFIEELQALRAEVERVAPLWRPNLDDGVLLSCAPLWRLMPRSQGWQKECKRTWDRLGSGDYDWAHLAMHLWPERVGEKCVDDRSLAIAHGLEGVFWHVDELGTWRKRGASEVAVRKVVAERTASTVKAALRDLLAAPTPRAGIGRGRRPSGMSLK